MRENEADYNAGYRGNQFHHGMDRAAGTGKFIFSKEHEEDLKQL